ncbi:MAG: GDP-mannose 4,6-dehydratase [Ignavibacteria bacterium]
MNEKIFVTGAGGFIGSHLVENLLQKGNSVKAFVRYNSKNNWGWLEDLKNTENLEIITGDIRDYDSVLSSMKDCKSVFHLAALIGIPYSYISPLAYIRTNIEGTYNIIEASRNLNINNVIVTSTSETYGSAQYTPIDEKHPLVGQSPYSASKISADEIALSYYRSFDLPVKVVRPFNTYGPRQSARAIIPSIIIQLLSNSKKINLGNINTVRDLTYIDDTVNGFIEIFESDKNNGEVTNIGSGTGISIKDLFNLICDLMKMKAEISVEDERVRPEKSEVQKLVCNNSKLKECTNWENVYSLEDGLCKTIEWIKNNRIYFKDNIYNI